MKSSFALNFVLCAFLVSQALGSQRSPAEPSITVKTSALADQRYEVLSFVEQEELSRLFTFQLDVVVERPLSFESLLGQEILVTLSQPGAPARFFHGICSRISEGQSGRRTVYSITGHSKAHRLTRNKGSRIYQELSVPEIVSGLLQKSGVDFEMKIEGNYPKRNFVVQYRETDFDFASRLMEEEGIYYFFQHSENGHTMILADGSSAHPELPPISFQTPAGRNTRPGTIFSWEKTQELRSGKVTLWDYSFEIPHNNLEASAVIQESAMVGQVLHPLVVPENAASELYDFPGEYAQRFDGVDKAGGDQPAELQKIFQESKRTASVRMQEEAAQSIVINGASLASGLSSGQNITLENHSRFNGKYVITGVTHRYRGSSDREARTESAYANSFTCIPSSIPFRPARVTPKPAIAGTQTAVVVGPPGEEIFSDKYGRVKVQFHWDREGKKDENSSCWIRVGAPFGGDGFGLVSIPRIGQEVIVSFLEGDPDQPIIVGAVPNPARNPVEEASK